MSQGQPLSTSPPLLHLRFADHRHLDDLPTASSTSVAGAITHRLPEGTPILLDAAWRPLQPWLDYFRVLASSAKPSTIRNYAYDALRFAGFLATRGTDVLNAGNDDILAYRDQRLHDPDKHVSAATWHRETVIIRGVYSYLRQTGQRGTPPWLTIGSTTPLSSRWTSEPDIRPLTRQQWTAFREIGLGGMLPDGSLDPSWRGANPLRSQAGAQLALTTGMRVGEFSSLLSAELPRNNKNGASVLLEAGAKYSKRRRIHVPPTTLQLVDLYRSTERRHQVEASRENLWARRESLYIITELDEQSQILHGSIGSTKSTWHLHQFPPHLRRIAVQDTGEGLEAVGLFVGRGGLPISLRAWHAAFEAASRRVMELASDQMGGRRVRVTPHDLRHTFAVVLLKQLTERSLAKEVQRQADGLGAATVSEHMAINPRLTVQRLLGHSDPATTMVYLRYIEDTNAMIQDAFEAWDDAGKTFAQLVVAERSNQR